jgi:hypothetical protein
MSECSKCGSPYHGDDACPQATRRRKKSTFKTRKELGLGPNEIPFKFRVDIDPEKDNEVEVSRKRALLRLNSQRVYMQMGCAVKAHNSMRETAKWIANLFENMDEEDRTAAASVFMRIEGLLFGLENLSNQKILQAVNMEELVERERRRAQAARVYLSRIAADKYKKANQLGVLVLGDVPSSSVTKTTNFSFPENLVNSLGIKG